MHLHIPLECQGALSQYTLKRTPGLRNTPFVKKSAQPARQLLPRRIPRSVSGYRAFLAPAPTSAHKADNIIVLKSDIASVLTDCSSENHPPSDTCRIQETFFVFETVLENAVKQRIIFKRCCKYLKYFRLKMCIILPVFNCSEIRFFLHLRTSPNSDLLICSYHLPHFHQCEAKNVHSCPIGSVTAAVVIQSDSASPNLIWRIR